MIGDWVVYNGDVEYICPIRIEGMDIATDMLITSDREDVGFDGVDPIPLTTEILEKNGFYYGYTSNEEDLASSTIAQLSEDDKGWCWDEGDGAIKVIFPNETDGGLLILDDQSFDRHLVMGFGETIFLHELQNALRLCEIKKEIVL